MARIKFLDVLEETRHKPDTGGHESAHSSYNQGYYQETADVQDRYYRAQNTKENNHRACYQDSDFAQKREFGSSSGRNVNDIPIPSHSGYRKGSEESIDRMHTKPSFDLFTGLDDHKLLWTGVLFVFFGGLLFLSGYWLGKMVTTKVKEERQSIVERYNQDIRKEIMYSHTETPPVVEIVSTDLVDTLPISTQTTQTKEVIVSTPVVAKPLVKKKEVKATVVAKKPAAVPAVKSVDNKKQFVIQISAHSNLQSARLVEDNLKKQGYSSYTSESMIGDTVFFRVRIRGFTSKLDAQKQLEIIKSKGLGSDGFIIGVE